MSLNSVEARYSIAGLNGPWNVGVYPDTDKAQAWRQASGWGYAGILLTVTVAAATEWIGPIYEATYQPLDGTAAYQRLDAEARYQPLVDQEASP